MESADGVDAWAGTESAGGAEAGADVGSVEVAGFGGVSVVVGAVGAGVEESGVVESDATWPGVEESGAAGAGVEESGAGVADESGAATGGAAEVESATAGGSVSAILSFGMTCAMPSSACSSRGVSSGYFVFHSATIFASGLVSITEKRRTIEASSMARIRSIDWVVPIVV